MLKAIANRSFATKATFKSLAIKSALYVPGNQKIFLNKCVKVQPSVYVPDMEDSVPFDEKEAARDLIASYVSYMYKNQPDVKIMPRVNHLNDLFYSEIEHILKYDQNAHFVHGFCIPKVDTLEEMKEIDEFLSRQEKELGIEDKTYKVIAGIESPLGIVNNYQICHQFRSRVVAVAFGGDDYCTDFGIVRTPLDKELTLAKQLCAMYCHAAGVVAMDTPYIHFKDMEGMVADLEEAKSFGFKGKMAIHPIQVDYINEAFSASQEQVHHATRLVEQFEICMKEGKAAIVFDNKMVDIPQYKRALNIMRAAGLRE